MRKKSAKPSGAVTPQQQSAPAAAAPAPPAAAPAAAVESSSSKRERTKSSCTVSSRMRQVVEQMIACDEEQYQAMLQQTTVFVFKSQQSELITCFLEEMRRENPSLFRDRDALMRVVGASYDMVSARCDDDAACEAPGSTSPHAALPTAMQVESNAAAAYDDEDFLDI